jgi:hypothetical protein
MTTACSVPHDHAALDEAVAAAEARVVYLAAAREQHVETLAATLEALSSARAEDEKVRGRRELARLHAMLAVD